MLKYILTFVVFGVLDALWLGVIAGGHYRQQLGALLADPIRWAPAAAFYAIYVVGLVTFVIGPAIEQGNAIRAFGYGAAFGLVAYATYNLTALAVIRDYPTNLALLDLAWGTIASGVTAGAVVLIHRAMQS